MLLTKFQVLRNLDQNFLFRICLILHITLQSDSDDLSETFMHNLEERCSDFQSVNSIFKNLTDVSDSSVFRYPYFRLTSLKNVVLFCVFFAISLTVLFQITTDPQIFFF